MSPPSPQDWNKQGPSEARGVDTHPPPHTGPSSVSQNTLKEQVAGALA